MVAAFLPALPNTTAAADPPAPKAIKVAADLNTAARAARQQGSRVEVANLRAEDRLVYAEPQGTTMAEFTPGPVRVRKKTGWVGISTDLIHSNGRIEPKAAAVDLSFSPGGTEPMVRFGENGKQITLTWPGRLPTPRLTGDTATYAEVRPGVDLVLRAERTGYTQHLVVKNPAAARALTSIQFGLTTTGVRLTTDKTGALQARDTRGALIFTAPPSAMWDSKALRSVAKVATTNTALTLTPDQKLLRNPKAKFPITIDPNLETFVKSFWTSVSSGNAGTAYPNSSPGGNVAQVGYCGFSTCNGIGVMRSYFQYNTAAGGLLAGKRIMGVWLDTSVVHSADCSLRKHKLFGTSPIGSGTSWDTAPAGWQISEGIVPGDWRACAGHQFMSFVVPTNHINPGSTSTYFIVAESESDKLWWRKYDPDATKLRVKFNTAPSTPNPVWSDPAVPTTTCKWCGETRYFNAGDMLLNARLTDPDTNAVKPEWHIRTNGALDIRWGTLQTNANHDTRISPPDGATIDWHVRGWDTDIENNGNLVDASEWVRGPGAPFVVDRTAPNTKPKVTGLLYKKEENRWRGGVGVPGTFVVERTALKPTDPGYSDTADVDHYLWGTQNPPTTKVDADALGGKASFTFTPTVDGPQDIFVQSVDRAGNESETETYHIYVRSGNGPYAQYSLDGNAKDTAYLGDRDGTLNGGARYAPGAVGSAVRLDGEHASSVTAPSAIRMDSSFSVSAWVNLDKAPPADDHTFTALSQDGASVSGFFLGYRRLTTGDRWEFAKPDKDDANTPGGNVVRSSVPAQTKTWTHLTAVHDAEQDEIRIYVNGVRSNTNQHVAHAPFGGSTRIGGGVWSGFAGANPWPGLVDEVKLYDRELSDAEIRAAVGQDNVQAGYWRFDELTGTTARNQVDGAESMILHNGAAFTGSTGDTVNGGVRLDGSDDYAATTGPALRTDQSFTVTGWANATAQPSPTSYQAAVSAEGAVNSAFTLGYRHLPTGAKWELTVPSADQVTRPADAQIRSNGTAALNTPTHLAAVYDAPANQIRLYVGGKLAGTAARPNGFDASGPLIVGRSKWEGVTGNHWAGVVDEVRAYSRELSQAEIEGLVARSNITAGRWKLDQDASDSSGNNKHGSLVGDVTWANGQTSVPDQADRAVRLNGTGQHVTAPHTFDPTQSFAVTAWAKLDGGTGMRTVLAQAGDTASALKLRATADGRWSFSMFDKDIAGGGIKGEVLGSTAQVGVWTHLVAQYDAAAGQIALFVNGVPAGTASYRHPWNRDTGLLQFGRARWDGQYVEYFPGAIDDVTAYQRVLFADEIRAMAGRDLALVHNWALDEPTGANAADAIGARGGTINGATHVPGRLGNALDFDGVDDTVTTTGVDLDTSKAFTVASWVKLDRICDPGGEFACRLTAVSLDGGQPSKFRLGHYADQDNHDLGAWIFEMPNADGSVTKASVSAIQADLNKWVHLVGVYDASAKQIWLYVNANRQDDGTLDTPWAASGGLQIGRGRVAGSPAEFWDGAVDDVRVYNGALDKTRIENLYAGYPPLGAPAVLPPATEGHWKFDESASTTVADSSGKSLTATMKGGATRVGSRSIRGGWFDGIDDFAETAGKVLTTNASFSVSAWVYLTGGSTGHRTIVAQDGDTGRSAFLLQYADEHKKWSVMVPGSPNHKILNSTELAARDEWTHLTVAYDAGQGQLKLYVQGVPSGAMTGVTVPGSSGPFSIGRARWDNANVDNFTGGIDEVRAFKTALSDDEVRKVHADVAAVMLDHYKFDDNTLDSSGRAVHGTATGTVSYGASVFPTGKAIQLDGSTGSVETAGRTIVAADDFTVSAWAKLTQQNQVATVLGQNGRQRSGFVLQYRPGYGTWVFGGPANDTLASPAAYAIAAKPAQAGQWTHLTGVYDHGEGQLRLYVDGQLAGVRENVTLANVKDSMTIGRATYDGKKVDFFPGAIDEVLTEQGIPTPAQVVARGTRPTS